ncbi:hypothetical protein SFK304_0648 [Shigella flexneri K-304]|uniref:Uncharacterized protein n=1 Tax=Shigella flexneri 2a str. 301 TaxID=198214 RepID=A0AB36PA14_SHIFL|nr:hypothetical protein SFy_0612 [Shigella flexneri 2003036]AIL39343.1 hypothetical protein SFyv_0649 [Shigella flexneri Shi06HN006]EFS11287.1 hypothetical protein SF2457T_4613 [Shigella flexneri 2a str. 2457T]EGJ91123.1 hypothetical protein SF434370_0690 [Shigella flexneri 4343-70]EGJ91760.1 hypothetical protein SF274771_0570 [Shigella flexneri 2747-71]EGJ94083.1 hypothetical protein SFK671_0546 [Shigella flexneri K-671]EGJ98648.1 bifunctional tail domain protein [Shigella flexneri 2930-71]
MSAPAISAEEIILLMKALASGFSLKRMRGRQRQLGQKQ